MRAFLLGFSMVFSLGATSVGVTKSPNDIVAAKLGFHGSQILAIGVAKPPRIVKPQTLAIGVAKLPRLA